MGVRCCGRSGGECEKASLRGTSGCAGNAQERAECIPVSRGGVSVPVPLRDTWTVG